MAQTQNQEQKENQIQDRRTVILDYHGAKDIIATIERLALAASCVPSGLCDPAAALLTIDKLFVTFHSNSGMIKIRRGTVIRGIDIEVRSDDCILFVDDVEFKLVCDHEIVHGDKLTWNGTEEVYTPGEFFTFVRDAIRSILDTADWL